MWQLGEDDWIKYGWGENLSSTWSSGACLYIDLSNYSVSDLPVAECAKIAVEYLIANEHLETGEESWWEQVKQEIINL